MVVFNPSIAVLLLASASRVALALPTGSRSELLRRGDHDSPGPSTPPPHGTTAPAGQHLGVGGQGPSTLHNLNLLLPSSNSNSPSPSPEPLGVPPVAHLATIQTPVGGFNWSGPPSHPSAGSSSSSDSGNHLNVAGGENRRNSEYDLLHSNAHSPTPSLGKGSHSGKGQSGPDSPSPAGHGGHHGSSPTSGSPASSSSPPGSPSSGGGNSGSSSPPGSPGFRPPGSPHSSFEWPNDIQNPHEEDWRSLASSSNPRSDVRPLQNASSSGSQKSASAVSRPGSPSAQATQGHILDPTVAHANLDQHGTRTHEKNEQQKKQGIETWRNTVAKAGSQGHRQN